MNNQPVPPMPQPQPANENKSQGQPPQPGQQPMPMQPGYGAPMQPMMPKKGANKGLIWGLIGGGIGLFVLVAIIIIAVVFFGGPSKADYADAARMMSEFDSKNISNSESFAGSDGSAEDLKKNIDKLLGEYDAYMEKLGKSKAMRDKEAKKMVLSGWILIDKFNKTNLYIYKDDEIYEEINTSTPVNFENGLTGIGWGI